MTPAAAISALNRALASIGEPVTLRRKSGTQGIPLDVEVRAVLTAWSPTQQDGFAAEGETLAVLSPTEMTGRQWCWPPLPGDFVVVGDAERTVRGVNPVGIGATLVRVELALIGGAFGR